MFNIAVFVSGRGSNLVAIHSAIIMGQLNSNIVAVVSNKSNCKALEFAQQKNISVFIVDDKPKEGKISYSKLTHELKSRNVSLIVLAGFLKKIPSEFISNFKNKIINIHPALLPAFGGKGMYGMNVHKAVFNSSAKVSGPTVHFVDEIYDNGKIISQKAVDISDVKSPEEIAERVLKAEHTILPQVIKDIAEDKIKIVGNRVIIQN